MIFKNVIKNIYSRISQIEDKNGDLEDRNRVEQEKGIRAKKATMTCGKPSNTEVLE